MVCRPEGARCYFESALPALGQHQHAHVRRRYRLDLRIRERRENIRPLRRRRNILAIVTVDAPGGVEVMLQPEPGVSVTELEAVEFLLDAEKC